MVAPLAGVWIEIFIGKPNFILVIVAPLAGVWIEMRNLCWLRSRKKSLPLRECGLKFTPDGYRDVKESRSPLRIRKGRETAV